MELGVYAVIAVAVIVGVAAFARKLGRRFARNVHVWLDNFDAPLPIYTKARSGGGVGVPFANVRRGNVLRGISFKGAFQINALQRNFGALHNYVAATGIPVCRRPPGGA